MRRHLIERWTDTTTFGVVLIFSALLVLPVLAVGLIVSVGLIIGAVVEQTAEFVGAVVVVLSVGGAVGMVGWQRARHQTKRPDPPNPTAILVCLVIGTATAFAVGAIGTAMIVEMSLSSWGSPADLWPAALFVAAPIAWVLSGIGLMQKLIGHYEERTGRVFDGIPAVLSAVALALVVAVALVLTAL